MRMGGVMTVLPGFVGSGAQRFGVCLVLILVFVGSICNSQRTHNCTDLILTNGTLVIDTDCGVWYLVCDDNSTSCLSYDVTNGENVTYTCTMSIEDLVLEFESSEDGSGDDTTPWLSPTQLWNPTTGTTSTSDNTESSMTNPSSVTPETTVLPGKPETTTPYKTTSGQSTGMATGTDDDVSCPSDTTPGTLTAGSTVSTTEGATTTLCQNATVVKNVTEIVSTDMIGTTDYTTLDPSTEQLDCDQRYSASVNQQVVLRGSITYHNYTDDFNTTWHYGVATFHVNGSLYLGSALRVEVRGENALRVHSAFGDVIINTTVHLDRMNSSQNGHESNSFADQHLGGFGRARGLGGAAPNSSDGAGHGGMGGAMTPSTRYSQAYLVNETEHLLGGSAGGTSTDIDGTKRAVGGGALEMSAAGFIYVGSEITARGDEGGQLTTEGQDFCRGGGSGGLIRLIAKSIYIMDAGSLNVEGGNGSLAKNDNACGGGGAGGVVQLLANESCLGFDSLNVQGGIGFKNGEQGVVINNGSDCSTSGDVSIDWGGGRWNGNGNGNGNGKKDVDQATTESGSSSSPETSDETASDSQITTSTTTEYAGSTGSILSTPTTSRPTTSTPDSTTSASVSTTSASVSTTSASVSATPASVSTTSASVSTTPASVSITSASVSTTTTTGSGSASPTPTISTPVPTTAKITSNNTVVRRELVNIISSFSVGTTSNNASSSANISAREAATQLKELDNAMSNVALSLLQGLADDEPLKTTIVVGETAVAIEIVPVADFEGTSFPSGDSKSTSDDANISIPTVVLPENATGHLVSVFILHTTPPPLGGNLVENTGSNVSFELNSQVISASVSLANDGAVSFNEPITIVLRNNQEDSTENSSLCVFYDFSADNNTGAWSTEGCRASDVNATHVTCSCDHLTNFAILLQINDIEISEKDQLILQIISQVGIGLSLIFLTAGFIVIIAALKSLNNREAAIIHLNLMGAMIVGHLIFLIGIDDVYDQKRCKAVAMLLHFFYLVTFFWMLMEGVHIYFRATRVFKSTNYQLKIFHVFAWGTPGLIVMITALVNIDFYGTEQACWLSRERGAIWAFAGPVVFVIAMNIIVLVVVLQTFLTIKSINSKSKFEQAKRSTRAAVVLLPLLGITWIFGFLATGSTTIFFQYAFALLNSVQGVFICIFHCFTNDDVMKVVKLRYKRSKQQFDAIPSNHSIGGRFRSTTSTNKVSAVGRKEAFGEKSTISTTATDTSVF